MFGDKSMIKFTHYGVVNGGIELVIDEELVVLVKLKVDEDEVVDAVQNGTQTE
jgi:hypothetical protein